MILICPGLVLSNLFQCQEAKWALSNYENGITEGMEHVSHHDLKVNCEYMCGNCDRLSSQDFVNQQGCYRTGYHSFLRIE